MSYQSAEIDQLATALASAQGELENAPKMSENPHFHSRYADLATVIKTCRAPLSKHGLSVVQALGGTHEEPILRTTLLHKSGQWIMGDFPLIGDMSRVQVLGSLLTYARRYSLAAMVGIAQEDDDANGANGGHYDPNPVRRAVDESRGRPAAPSRPSPAPTQPSTQAPEMSRIPTSGRGLFAWAAQASKDTGFDWVSEVARIGKQMGYPPKMIDWNHDHIESVWRHILEFLAPAPGDESDARDDDDHAY